MRIFVATGIFHPEPGGPATYLHRLLPAVQARRFAHEYGPEGGVDDFARCMYGADLRDPELLIRTSGEQRLSNFLLWQSAYAELYFSPRLWPDFDEEALAEALADYARRHRRFGGREMP